MGKSAVTTQKRRAPTQAGPAKSKKMALDKQHKPSAAKDSKRRTVPVTQVAARASEDSDSDSFEDEDLDIAEGVDGEVNDSMDVDQKPAKDPNGEFTIYLIRYRYLMVIIASRESHKVQKDLLNQRRAAKRHSELLTNAKRVWAQARRKDIPTAERRKHVAELMDVIRGQVKDVVLKHDASRIVQTAVKYGTQQERDQVASELKGKYKELAQSKYSKVSTRPLLVTKWMLTSNFSSLSRSSSGSAQPTAAQSSPSSKAKSSAFCCTAKQTACLPMHSSFTPTHMSARCSYVTSMGRRPRCSR